MTKQVEGQMSTVKSADRVLDIFELFAEVREPMALTDIAKKLHWPTSSTYKIIQNLLSRGYLETDKHEKMFCLGYKIFEIGRRYVHNTNLTTEFLLAAQRIVDDINESVFLSIRDGDKILYIAEKQSTQSVRFVSHLGMKLPLHATAMGKVLLSYLTPGEMEQIYPQDELGALTETTICSLSELKNQLAEIRAEGLAYSKGEAVQGVRCAAAPIFNTTGQVIAAMSVSIPASRMNDELWRKTVQWVRQVAEELSIKLYFQQN